MRATIKDVAQKSGYSITTVSLVLNSKATSIPQSTQDAIWTCAESLNYRPNQLAVSIVTKRSRVLGLIIPDNSNQFFSTLSRFIEAAARKAGYALIYGNSDNNAKRDIAYMQMFADYQVDGIIYTKSASEPGDDDANLQIMRNCSVPLVVVDREVTGSEAVSVTLDHCLGGYLATRHLLEQGHTRIGCLTGPVGLLSGRERLRGYRTALEEAGSLYAENLIFEGNYQFRDERAAMDHFLTEKVTAIFSSNDMMAFGLYRDIQRRGLSVPDDISVVGFDNTPFCEFMQPPLTSIAQPIEEIGDCAVSALLDLIHEKQLPAGEKSYIFEPKLVVRESTGRLDKGGSKP